MASRSVLQSITTMSIKPGLYAITDFSSVSEADVYLKTEIILRGGISMLQYRDKSGEDAVRLRRARELKRLCNEFNTPLIINDDVSLANQCKADGVHLGKNDTSINTARDLLGPVIIGCSCYNSIERAQQAESAGADYVAFGAFYDTTSKQDAVKAEPELLVIATQRLRLPIVAIGGITPKNAKVLIDGGADLVAVISALYGVEDTVKAIHNFNLLFEQEQ